MENLNNFNGTEHYYKGYLNVLYTDGVQFVALNGASWLITDISSVLKCESKVKKEGFVCIKFSVFENTAKVIYTDGNNNVLFSQKYKYTDFERHFKEKEVIFYFIDGVLLLSSEY